MTAVDGAARILSPLGDQREREVCCTGRYACRRLTWAWSGICDECWSEVAGIDDTTAELAGIATEAPEGMA